MHNLSNCEEGSNGSGGGAEKNQGVLSPPGPLLTASMEVYLRKFTSSSFTPQRYSVLTESKLCWGTYLFYYAAVWNYFGGDVLMESRFHLFAWAGYKTTGYTTLDNDG